jgi:hypothetical protein
MTSLFKKKVTEYDYLPSHNLLCKIEVVDENKKYQLYSSDYNELGDNNTNLIELFICRSGITEKMLVNTNMMISDIVGSNSVAIYNDAVLYPHVRLSYYAITNKHTINVVEIPIQQYYTCDKNYVSIYPDIENSSNIAATKMININIICENLFGIQTCLSIWISPSCQFSKIKDYIFMCVDNTFFNNNNNYELSARDLMLLPADVQQRYKYRLNKNANNNLIFDKKIIKRAVKREEQIRLSIPNQIIFYNIEKGNKDYSQYRDWIDRATEIQYIVALECVGIFKAKQFVEKVRYTDLEDYQPHWKKYNRAGRGFNSVRNYYPDTILLPINASSNGSYTHLKKIVSKNRSVLIASSIT